MAVHGGCVAKGKHPLQVPGGRGRRRPEFANRVPQAHRLVTLESDILVSQAAVSEVKRVGKPCADASIGGCVEKADSHARLLRCLRAGGPQQRSYHARKEGSIMLERKFSKPCWAQSRRASSRPRVGCHWRR